MELWVQAIEPAETGLDVGVEAASVAGEPNGVPVAVLAVTKAGPLLILQMLS